VGLGLENKVMLVAASSKGLGYGVARALAQNGAKVSMCSRSGEEVEAAAKLLHDETGAETLATPCDVSKPDEVQAWIRRTVEKWGVVHGLLVNAGGPPSGYFKDLTDEQWQAAFDLTLMGTIRMIRYTLPHMTEGGSILAITSYSINQPIEALALSTVMRSGVAALLKTLAEELAPDGIRVNNLVPGRILTDRTTQLDTNAAKRRGITLEQVREESVRRIPLGRMGTTEEFGNVGAFLLSPAASYVTGATVRVDGGLVRSI
jgi:3-oxoacyl-[acyl-carrier protein] reductase